MRYAPETTTTAATAAATYRVKALLCALDGKLGFKLAGDVVQIILGFDKQRFDVRNCCIHVMYLMFDARGKFNVLFYVAGVCEKALRGRLLK